MRRPLHLLLSAGLVLSLATAVGAATTSSAPSASAAECPASGGVAIPPAKAAGDVVFRGGGWGHGLGMSQYGAQGAARLGCSYEQILTPLLRGHRGARPARCPTWSGCGCSPAATASTSSGPSRPAAPAVAAASRAASGPTTGADPAAPPCPPVQPEGATLAAAPRRRHGQFVLWDLGVTPKAARLAGGSARAAAAPAAVRRRRPPHHLARLVDLPRPLAALGLDPRSRSTAPRSTPCSRSAPPPTARRWTSTCGASPRCRRRSRPRRCRRRRSPRARTPRSAPAGCCMPTPADQNWTGWKKETEGTGGRWGRAWKAAVDATTGRSSRLGRRRHHDRRVLLLVDGRAHRGRALRVGRRGAVPACRRRLGVGRSPRATRPRSGPGPSASPGRRSPARLGFSSISTISVPPRGADARIGGVKVAGIQGGRAHHVVRRGLGRAPGARPALARLHHRHRGAPGAARRSRWSVTGTATARDELGWCRDGQVALQMTSRSRQLGQAVPLRPRGRRRRGRRLGPRRRRRPRGVPRRHLAAAHRAHRRPSDPDGRASAGPATCPVVGSWTGKATGIGVVRGRTWLLRRSLTSGHGAEPLRLRQASATSRSCGSWNGSARSRHRRRARRHVAAAQPAIGRAGPSTVRGLRAGRPTVRWSGTGTATAPATPAVVRGRTFLTCARAATRRQRRRTRDVPRVTSRPPRRA